MQNTTNPTGATELNQFLAGMVADAADELEAESLTEFDRFLAGLVADAAAELAVEDALEAAEAARAVAPVCHTSTAVHGPVDSVFAQSLARIMAELSDPETARLSELSPALAEAETTGRIGGKATPAFQEMSGSVKGKIPLKGTRHKLTRAVRSPDMTCTSPKAWSESILPDGSVKVRHTPCGHCDRCRVWWRRENALRFIHVAGNAQCTMIRVEGWESNEWDKAAAWLDAMGRRQPGQRWRGLQPSEDYTPTATAIYPCELSAKVIALVKADAKRKGLSVTVQIDDDDAKMDIGAFGGLQDTMKTRTGNVLNKDTREYVKHCTSRFVAWPDYDDGLPDYVNGDTVVLYTSPDVDLPEETPATEVESNLRRIKDDEWRAEAAAYIRMGRVEYLDIGLFLNLPNEPDPAGEVMQTIKRREYGGSSQLLIDAARHYVGDAPYRAAYCAVYERVFGDGWAYGEGE